MTTLISACDLAHTREARSPLRLTTLETQAGVFRFAGIRANAAGLTLDSRLLRLQIRL